MEKNTDKKRRKISNIFVQAERSNSSKTKQRTLSRFSTWRICSREQAKSECDWLVMTSVFLASQSSCFFLCLREQIRQVENRLYLYFEGRVRFEGKPF